MLATLEMFATKGTEYLLIIAYLLALIPFWMLMSRTFGGRRLARAVVDWFRVPDTVGFHPGHTWARRVGGTRVRVGIDDLAQAFVGTPESIHLPAVGEPMKRGERGWGLTVDGRELPMLSPVNGKVTAVNREVLDNPSLLADAYEGGWLLEVEVPSKRAALKELLKGESARAWMAATVQTLRTRMGGELGPVMQDGGTPVSGFGRQLGDDWPALCGQLFQTTELMAGAPEERPPEQELAP